MSVLYSNGSVLPCLIKNDIVKSRKVSFLKWKITKTRSTPAGGYLQATEFEIYRNATKYSWANNVSITSDMVGNTGQEIDCLIDGDLYTKFCTPDWGEVQSNECNIIIALGETITLDGNSSYLYITGGDEESRDPISWEIYGSLDGVVWDLLDSRSNATITTNRTAETFAYPFSHIVGEGEGSTTQKVEGTFTSPSSQHGIVDVEVGFKPDMLMVFMPLSGGNQDTVSYWEKDASWAETSAVWCLQPAEGASYLVALDRVDGETGIQAINDDGFSYMANGWNTQNCPCRYVAIKY